MSFIQGGKFSMGSDNPVIAQDGEGPAREVTLLDFYIDQHEVSNAEFARFVADTNYKTEVNRFLFNNVKSFILLRHIFLLILKSLCKSSILYIVKVSKIDID